MLPNFESQEPEACSAHATYRIRVFKICLPCELRLRMQHMFCEYQNKILRWCTARASHASEVTHATTQAAFSFHMQQTIIKSIRQQWKTFQASSILHADSNMSTKSKLGKRTTLKNCYPVKKGTRMAHSMTLSIFRNEGPLRFSIILRWGEYDSASFKRGFRMTFRMLFIIFWEGEVALSNCFAPSFWHGHETSNYQRKTTVYNRNSAAKIEKETSIYQQLRKLYKNCKISKRISSIFSCKQWPLLDKMSQSHRIQAILCL